MEKKIPISDCIAWFLFRKLNIILTLLVTFETSIFDLIDSIQRVWFANANKHFYILPVYDIQTVLSKFVEGEAFH